MKIAHLVSDVAFIDSAYELFEAIEPNSNIFFLPKNKKCTKYIKKAPIVFVSTKSHLNPIFIKKLSHFDLVILHSLSPYNMKVVKALSRRRKIMVWIGFGFDYYEFISGEVENLFLAETRKLYITKNKFKNSILSYFRKKIIKNAPIFGNRWCRKEKIISNISLFSPVLEDEYRLISERGDISNLPDYVMWNYGTNAKTIDRICEGKMRVNGINILLGNSASYYNNHIEMIDYLSQIDIQERKVICPLSYGDKEYGDYVKQYGINKLGSAFVPLIEFLPLEQYDDIISSCDTVIMNHVRQQAVGNVITMLALGAKIFLRNENPLHRYLKRNGLYITSIQDFLTGTHLFGFKIEEDDVNISRDFVMKNFGYEAAKRKTRDLIGAAMKKKNDLLI